MYSFICQHYLPLNFFQLNLLAKPNLAEPNFSSLNSPCFLIILLWTFYSSYLEWLFLLLHLRTSYASFKIQAQSPFFIFNHSSSLVLHQYVPMHISLHTSLSSNSHFITALVHVSLHRSPRGKGLCLVRPFLSA